MSDSKSDLDSLRKRARRCESDDDFDGAIAQWSRLLQLCDDAEAFERLGVLAMRRNDYGEAFRLLRKAVDLTPTRAKTRVLLARAADEAATPEEAFEAWDAAARLAPTAEAHFRMGVILGELGREDDAIDHLERAWAADPGRIKPLRSLAGIHELRADYDKAAEVWRRVAAGDNRTEALANLGRLCALAGEPDKALDYFEEALGAGDNAQILRKVAAIHEQRGEPDKAEDAWRRAIRTQDDAISRDRLGVLLRDQGRFDEAIDEFRAAAAHEPNIRRYWIQIARTCEKVGRLDDAEDAWRNVVAFAPDGDAYRRLTILQLKLNRPKEAVKTLENYVGLVGETADSWRKIADALEDADEPAAAADAWNRALAADPDDAVSKRRLSQLRFNEDMLPDSRRNDASPVGGGKKIGDRIGALFRSRRREDDGGGAFRDQSDESAVVVAMRRELDDIAASGAPVLIGPWLSELGFELLYWIPFLKWALRRSGIAPERITVASRGGMRPFYLALDPSIRYVDIFDFVSPDEFRELNERRWRDTGLQKHLSVGEAEGMLIRKFNLGEDLRLLHPKLMYTLFASFWSGRSGFRRYRSHVELSRLRPIEHPVLARLPESFVAAKFYSRRSFESTPENSARLQHFIARIAQKSPVVILNTGLSPDEHAEFDFADQDNVIFLDSAISPAENLHAQAAIISHSDHFYCTYGGFTYLPLYFGGAVSSYYSGDRHYLHVHGPAAYWTAEKIGARVSIFDADALEV